MSEILTSIEAISEGKPFPPYVSRQRIEGYETNLERFKGDYNKDKYIRIKNLYGGVDIFPLLTENFFKLMTLKLQGLLLNEKPILLVKDNDAYTSILNKIVNDGGFWKAFLSAYRNFSSFGSGVLYLSYKDLTPRVNSVNPKYVYKIVNPQNIDDVVCYVLVQPIYQVDYTSPTYDKVEQLRVLYHYKGYYIEKIFAYDESGNVGNIGKKLKQKKYVTGLSDFAVFVMDNATPIDEVWGRSDYDNIADIVNLYEQTLTIVGAVLVKNINPILQVPYGTLTQNEQTGKLEIAMADGKDGGGGLIEAEKDAADTKFITYDMQISDIMSFVTGLLNELGIQSEMSKTFLTGEFTSNLSGAAIKNLLKAPLDKISRSIDEMDYVLRSLFVQMLGLVDVKVTTDEIGIIWQDGVSLEDEEQPTPPTNHNQSTTTPSLPTTETTTSLNIESGAKESEVKENG